MTPPLTHPVWCHPAHCTVIGELLPLTGTAHRSRPVEFDLGPFVPADRRRLAAQLSQSVAPWETDVFLIVSNGDGEVWSTRTTAARELLAQLGALIDRAYPPLDEHRPAAETATAHGSPATADDDACRVHSACCSVRWLGESDDADNVWQCDVSGVQWRTKVRRPGNGVPFVLVIPAREGEWVCECLACGRDLTPTYPTEAEANTAAEAHTAEHEAAAGGDR